MVNTPKSNEYVSIGGHPGAISSSRSPHRRNASTPGAWMRWVDKVSLGNPARSTTRTRYPLRASSMAVGDPAQRAPTTIASYSADMVCLPCSGRPGHDDVIRPRGHRGGPLFGAWFLPDGVGGGLGPAPEAELGEDVADVVLHGLPADVEPVGDLRVRQPEAEQREHLSFTLGERPVAPPAGRGAGPERAKQRGGGVRVVRRLQLLERVESGAGLCDRDLGTLVAERPGELEPASRRLHRHLGAGE